MATNTKKIKDSTLDAISEDVQRLVGNNNAVMNPEGIHYLLNKYPSAIEYADGTLESFICEHVTSIRRRGLTDLPNLKTVDCPNLVTLYYYAVSGGKMTNFRARKLQTIGDGALSSCPNLTNLYLPNAVSVNNGSLYNCENLTTICFGKHFRYIGDQGIRGCSNLTYLFIETDTLSASNLYCRLYSANALLGTNFDDGTATTDKAKIYVADVAYDWYMTATNWAAYKAKIHKWSELADDPDAKAAYDNAKKDSESIFTIYN